MAGAMIEIDDVSKTYFSSRKPVPALESVSLTIRSGEFISVLGPSGCGKSTLMMITAGLVTPSTGIVRVNDCPVDSPLTDVGIVFQDDLLLPFRTAVDNVALQTRLRGMAKAQARAEAGQLLSNMGLGTAGSRYPSQLSGGMRQRVSLARAFVHRPSTLLMDEPFGALDAISRLRMQGLLESLWLEGERKTVVFITHSVEEAVRLSDRILVFSPSPGRVAAEITVDAARPRPTAIDDDPALAACSQRIYGLFDELGIFDSTDEQAG